MSKDTVNEALDDFDRVEQGLEPVPQLFTRNKGLVNRHIGRDRLAHLAACPICRARAKAVLSGEMCEGTAVLKFSGD